MGGTIPTKSLGLPDEYAFDEFGRRFTYIIDKRATGQATCREIQISHPTNGAVQVQNKDITGAVASTDGVMYAHLSHGPDGHGAFPSGGSSVADRINSGSADADTLKNAGVDASFTYNTTNFTATRVKKDRTAAFDDLVYYRGDIKNTCCLGAICVPLGFRIDGSTASGGSRGMSAATGDINGDGRTDLAVSMPYSKSVYVFFGGVDDAEWPNPLPVGNLGGDTGVNGTNGFRIFDNLWQGNIYGAQVAVGDINADGFDDIAYSVVDDRSTYTGRAYVVFGGGAGSGAWPATVNTNTLAGWDPSIPANFVNGKRGFYTLSGVE